MVDLPSGRCHVDSPHPAAEDDAVTIRLASSALLVVGCAAGSPVTPPVGPPAVVSEGLRLEEGRACRPGAPPPGVFTESADALGIAFEHVAQPPPSRFEDGRLQDFAGVAVADLDGDGALDLYFTNIGGPDHLYLTQGRGPAQLALWQRTGEPQSVKAIAVADLDGDGDRDAVLLAGLLPVWLENDGSGHLGSPRPLSSLFEAEIIDTYGAALGDVDGDGWIDAFLANHETAASFDAPVWPAREVLLRNTGGQFEDRSAWLPVRAAEDKTFVVCLMDLDDDGDLDLYEVNDAWSLAGIGVDPTSTERQGNRLYRNDGTGPDGAARLTDVSEQSHADITVSAMGLAVGDYDNDGLPDLYVTSMEDDPNALLHNDGGLVFSDRTDAMGAQTLTPEHDVSWGAVFLDADADGWLDLFVAHGYHTSGQYPDGIPINREDQPNVFLRNDGGHRFADATDAAGLGGRAWSRSPVVGDLDRDGFPDLVVGNAHSRPYVYLNGCDGRPWLTVRLDGPAPNRDGIGARIRVTAGGLRQTRLLQVGSDGLYGSSAPEAYFGFPAGTEAVDLEVRWPDGKLTTEPAVPVRRLATVRRR